MTKSTRISSLLFFAITLLIGGAFSQEPVVYADQILAMPDRVINKVNRKAEELNGRMIKQTERYLARIARYEVRLKRKLFMLDSAAAARIFGDIDANYSRLKGAATLGSRNTGRFNNRYIPYLDTLRTTFTFLAESGSYGNESLKKRTELENTLKNIDGLQSTFNQSNEIYRSLGQRRVELETELQKFGLVKELKQLKKEVYYYQAQVQEYKTLLCTPSRLEAKAIDLLSRSSVFKKFFATHSQLASLFKLPGSFEESTEASLTLAGLQTREAVQTSLIQRFGTGANVEQAMQKEVVGAHNALSELKNKLNQFAPVSSDQDIPDFKPNNQKTKTIKDRLELGTNLQTVKANRFFPSTSDFGISVGYKLNDRSIVGIGSALKVGWGKDLRHIAITTQGVTLRSFVDYKVKGNFFLTGGFEQSYLSAFNSVEVLKDMNPWQTSGLIGLSKKYSVSNKVSGNIQLLWDFFSYQQLPKSQPVLFRIGYTLK